jgi:DNA-binding transcriptional LysR family regulator
MLDPRRLEVLRAVAEHGSFTGAADALSFTQPAISKSTPRRSPNGCRRRRSS